MFLRWMFGVVLLVACQPTSLVAQEAMVLPDEVRKEMNFLVGDWTFTAKENGKSTSGFYSTRWASGGTCLTMTFRSDTHNSTGLSSWDPVTNEIVENWTGPSTGRLELRYQIKSDSEWEGTSTLSGIDGKVLKGKIRVEKNGPNSFRYTESTGDKTWDIENKRMVRSPGTTNQHVKELDAFVGNWERPGEDGAKILWTINWSPGMNFLNNQMLNVGADGDLDWSLNGTIGWDSGIQKITNWCVTDSGKQVKFVWTKIDDTTWEAVNESGQNTWKFTPMGDKLRFVTGGNEVFYERN